jgi:hypothetical protein
MKKSLTIAALAALGAAGLSAANVSGTVQTAAGKTIRASITIHDLSTPRTAGNTPFERRFGSKPDGSFQITGVPAGTYEFCVEALPDSVLDPCMWPGAKRETFVVRNATQTVKQDITVQTGYLLQVRLNDPQGVVAQAKTATGDEPVALQIMSGENRFFNATRLANDAAGVNYGIVVPFNQGVVFTGGSATVAIADVNNQKYTANSTRQMIFIPSGGKQNPITINASAKGNGGN